MESSKNKVEATILDVKLDINRSVVFIKCLTNNKHHTVAISPDQVIKFTTDQETVQGIMRDYAKAWQVRKEKGLPIFLELTDEQINGEESQ